MSEPRSEGGVSKQKRTRSGCMSCRAKRKKCDEARPKCNKCVRSNDTCEYGAVKFRPVSFDGNRTSVASASRPAASSQRSPTRWGTAAQAGKEATSAGRVEPQDEPAAASIAGPSPQVEDRNESSRLGQDDWPNRNNTGAVNHDSTPELGQMLPGAESSIDTTAPQAGMVHQIAPMIASTGPSTDGNVYGLPAFGHSPEDGIFEPGSIYQTLYRTLRRKVFHAAARAEEMPTTVQESTHTEPPVTHVSSRSPEQTRHAKEHQISDSDNDCELDMRQEYTLLKVWTEEVASWLDKVDRYQHFRYTIPILAKTKPHLKYAMLSLSARYLETIGEELPKGLSLALYQHAIQLLVPELYIPDIAVVASCVVLCVVEMYSCAPQAWQRHLDGCASLIQAMNIYGDSGGLEEALFWCFARMDLCGGLISFERTLIPVTNWSSGHRDPSDFSTYLSSPCFEDYAKLAFTLTAQAIDLFATFQASEGAFGTTSTTSSNNTYAQAWQKLFTAIESWFAQRPPEMQPLHSIPSTQTSYNTTTTPSPSSPFPTVLYSSAAGFSGNQFAHTAAILMLQRKPRHLTTTNTTTPTPNPTAKPRSILHHARQICGIALSNDHHGGWMNSIQPIWIAGKLMSHPSEHEALLKWLRKVEDVTGWATGWRRRELEGWWGV